MFIQTAFFFFFLCCLFFFLQAEDGIRDLVRSRGLGDVYKRQLNDVATIPANLAGIPGMSLPSGVADEDGLPTGFQILAPATQDLSLIHI